MWGRPLNHDDASCFDASRLSINQSVADFMKNMFSETAVLPESPDCHITRNRGGDIHTRENRVNAPSHFYHKVVCERGAYFQELTVLTINITHFKLQLVVAD